MSMFGWAQIQTHPIFQFFDELQVTRNLECFGQVRLHPCARHTLRTVVAPTPAVFAIVRVLQ